jgi:hypothetical protein
MLVEMQQQIDALPDQVHYISSAGNAGQTNKHE